MYLNAKRSLFIAPRWRNCKIKHGLNWFCIAIWKFFLLSVLYGVPEGVPVFDFKERKFKSMGREKDLNLSLNRPRNNNAYPNGKRRRLVLQPPTLPAYISMSCGWVLCGEFWQCRMEPRIKISENFAFRSPAGFFFHILTNFLKIAMNK